MREVDELECGNVEEKTLLIDMLTTLGMLMQVSPPGSTLLNLPELTSAKGIG